MLDDLTEKIQSSQNAFEKLTAKIPGYRGYKLKEQRREADKLLRLHIAREYEVQLRRLNEMQYTVTSQGDLKAMMPLERSSMRLQLLIDRLKTASYGYAGLFDAVKVDEDALDRLYAFDEGMLAGADRLSAQLDELSQALDAESLQASDVNALLRELDELNNEFSRRQDVIVG